jgi:hypothetical protein
MRNHRHRHHRLSPHGLKLNKRFIATHDDYDFYAVNAYAVRDLAQPDEEFGSFATQDDFRDLIPRGEVWLDEHTIQKEGLFFIANALTQLKEQARGVPEDKAYTEGIHIEQMLRERLNHRKFRGGRPQKRVPEEVYVRRYATLPDKDGTVTVWVVDGNIVRSLYKTDYTEGGHGYVYPWVPRDEIWIEESLDRRELPYIVAHEYLEHRLMRDAKLDYDTAHEICSRVEFKLRKNQRIKLFLAPGRRKIHKRDLPRLADDDFFHYVVNHFVKTRRDGKSP